MNLTQISAGRTPPTDLNVIVEIPFGSPPVKYELDKASGLLFVDRFLQTAMFYPGNYGFIPHTLSEDGDPCDVLIVGNIPVISGAVIRCRPVGVLLMEDESGPDEKVIAVPVEAVQAGSEKVLSYRDLSATFCSQVTHFFQHYKDLEPGKWVKIRGWQDVDSAKKVVTEAIERARLRSLDLKQETE